MRLILIRGNERLAVELRDGVYTLGRDERSDVAIPDSTVSGKHAEIHVQGEICTLRDLGSSNGTLINGVRIRGAQQIHPNDDVQLGSARLSIEGAGTSPQPAAPTKKGMGALSRQEAERLAAMPGATAEPVKPRIPWAIRFWLAGAVAVLVFALLVLVVELYTQGDVQRARRVGRYMAFAAQYIHPLLQAPAGPVPPPVIDSGLQEPFYILDLNGKILHPPSQPGQPERPSPLLDAKTGKIPDRMKLDLQRVDLPARSGPPVRVYSYPIRHGGDLLGYVLARPGPAASNLGLVSMMLLCTAAIALLALYFAMRGVTSEIREHIAALSGKLSPFAHGFVDALPRSPRVPELNELAGEAETVLRSINRAQPAAAAPMAAQGGQYNVLLTPLLEAAALPYCFITNDFHLLSGSADLLSFVEFARARTGTSIFEGGMNSVQSKQLVGAINEARNSGSGQTLTTLTRGGAPQPYVVHVRRIQDAATGMRGYGLLFAARPASEG
jgi:hypothetical protein